MTKPRKWSLPNLIDEAKRYDTLSDFMKGSEGAYKAYLKMGRPEEVYSLFPLTKTYWTEETAKREASKYTSRWAFQKSSGGAYRFLWKRGLLEEIFPPRNTNKWCEDSVRIAAKGCKTRMEFKNKAPGAHKWAYNNGLLGDLFGHTDNTPLSDNNVVYLWKVEGYCNLFKVGVTSDRLGTHRIRFVCRKSGLKYESLYMFKTDRALNIEKEILSRFRQYDFNFSFSGSTEFVVIPPDDFTKLIKSLEGEIDG